MAEEERPEEAEQDTASDAPAHHSFIDSQKIGGGGCPPPSQFHRFTVFYGGGGARPFTVSHSPSQFHRFTEKWGVGPSKGRSQPRGFTDETLDLG